MLYPLENTKRKMGYAGCAVSHVVRQLDESPRESLGYAKPIVRIPRVFHPASAARPIARPDGEHARLDPQWLHLSSLCFHAVIHVVELQRGAWIHIFINPFGEVRTA